MADPNSSGPSNYDPYDSPLNYDYFGLMNDSNPTLANLSTTNNDPPAPSFNPNITHHNVPSNLIFNNNDFMAWDQNFNNNNNNNRPIINTTTHQQALVAGPSRIFATGSSGGGREQPESSQQRTSFQPESLQQRIMSFQTESLQPWTSFQAESLQQRMESLQPRTSFQAESSQQRTQSLQQLIMSFQTESRQPWTSFQAESSQQRRESLQPQSSFQAESSQQRTESLQQRTSFQEESSQQQRTTSFQAESLQPRTSFQAVSSEQRTSFQAESLQPRTSFQAVSSEQRTSFQEESLQPRTSFQAVSSEHRTSFQAESSQQRTSFQEGSSQQRSTFLDDTRALTVWPPEVMPFHCSCCQVLREIIHADAMGNCATKLEIHGRIGIISHAVLEIKDRVSLIPSPSQFHMIDFCKKSLDNVREYLQKYCDDQRRAGLVMVQDPLSTFYEALCVGIQPQQNVNNEQPVVPGGGAIVPVQVERALRAARRNLAQQRERAGRLTLRDFDNYFHLPIEEAARRLDLCPTVVKKICRREGMNRWPYRKIKGLRRQISNLRSILSSNNPVEIAQAEAEIHRLEHEIADICAGGDGANN